MILRKIISSVLVVLLISGSPLTVFGARIDKKDVVPDSEKLTSQLSEEERLIEERKVLARTVRGLDVPVDPDTYVIGPSDVFLLSLRGQSQTNLKLTVLPEGVVILPNVGAFQAAGLTITEFKKQLFAAMDSFYRNIDYECHLLLPRSFIVYVLGAVDQPGAVELQAPFRAATALNTAGGTKDRGSLRYIELREEGKPTQLVDLFGFFGTGDVDKNPVLHEGQSLFVPVKSSIAVVMGAVWKRGSFEVYDTETISDLIEYGGGLTGFAETDRVLLERYDGAGRVTTRTVAVDEIDKVTLQHQDVVIVPDRRIIGGSAFVRVFNNGGRQGRMYIQDGETLGSFAPRFMRSNEKNDFTRAVVERRGDDGSLEHFTVNLETVVKGEAASDFVLRNGDVVSVPAVDDQVFVAGEVVSPGEVDYQSGMPAERYVSLASGTNSSGSMDKLSIYSSTGKKRSGDRHSMIYPGDTIVVERKTTKIIGSAILSLASVTGLVLSIVAISTMNK